MQSTSAGWALIGVLTLCWLWLTYPFASGIAATAYGGFCAFSSPNPFSIAGLIATPFFLAPFIAVAYIVIRAYRTR